jgi:predicted dehydrogenase
MSKIRVGVIGCGYWGPKLARNFNEIPGAQLTWVADLRAERLAHLRGLYPNVCATLDYRDVLASDVDAVAIATPVASHHKLALEALRAGKHILVEKPLAANVAHAREIATMAEQLGLVAKVGHTFQHNRAVETVRALIARGELGKIFYINATRVNLGLFQPDINVVWDLAPHDISILMHILERAPSDVSARGAVCVQKERGLHDVAYLTLHFGDDILADLRVSWLDPVKIRRITVVGSKKMLVYDDIAENKVIVYDKGVEIPPYSDTLEEFHLSYRHGPETVVPIEWREPLRDECETFVQCVRSGFGKCSDCPRAHPWTCTHAQMGVKVVQVLEAAHRSLHNGGGKEKVAE